MPEHVVTLHIEHVALDVGHWCLSCQHATGVRHWVMVSSQFGMHLQPKLRCYECGSTNVVLDAEVAVASGVDDDDG